MSESDSLIDRSGKPIKRLWASMSEHLAPLTGLTKKEGCVSIRSPLHGFVGR